VERTVIRQVPRLVSSDELGTVWGEVAPWIEQAIPYAQGDENLTDILVGIAQNRFSLWYTPDRFAAVTQVIKQPRHIVATILYAGGADMAALEEAFAFYRGWCKEKGIQIMRVWGREGWERQLKMQRVGIILQSEVV